MNEYYGTENRYICSGVIVGFANKLKQFYIDMIKKYDEMDIISQAPKKRMILLARVINIREDDKSR